MRRAVIRKTSSRREGVGEPIARTQLGRVPHRVVGRRGVRLLRGRLAVDPGDGRADRYLERIGMEAEIPDRDEVVHRVDDGDGHAALRRAVDGRPGAAFGETGGQGEASECEGSDDEPFHGCLTTMTAFMKGCGVQWKAYSPGCANVWVHVLPGSIGPESQEPSSAVIVWTSGSLLVQRTVEPAATSMRLGLNVMVRISTCTAF